MSKLRVALKEYLALRRALGFKLELSGQLLQKFVDFAEHEGTKVITIEVAQRWAMQPSDSQPAQWANRLGMVRRFAQYLRAFDPRTEVPPTELCPYRYQRPQPYIYSDDEVKRLIRSAMELPSALGLRRYTYATILGLLAVTGMRTNEPLHLDCDDVDFKQALITVHDAKFGKSRHIPLHSSTARVLQNYAAERDCLCLHPQSDSFFLSEGGTRITDCCLRWTFVKLSREIGLREPAKSFGHGPRLLDFRHRFAVNTLIGWYRSGVDVERHMHELSTYLGHDHVTDTYWYLSATAELMGLAARQLNRTIEGRRS
jgi:integrase